METDAAFAAASVLLNLLIVLVLSGSFWVFYSILSRPETIGLMIRENLWR
jgi:hypothetical protein